MELTEILPKAMLLLAAFAMGLALPAVALSSPIGGSGAGQDLLRRSMMHTPPVTCGDKLLPRSAFAESQFNLKFWGCASRAG